MTRSPKELMLELRDLYRRYLTREINGTIEGVKPVEVSNKMNELTMAIYEMELALKKKELYIAHLEEQKVFLLENITKEQVKNFRLQKFE